jgi:hypothetical protein
MATYDLSSVVLLENVVAKMVSDQASGASSRGRPKRGWAMAESMAAAAITRCFHVAQVRYLRAPAMSVPFFLSRNRNQKLWSGRM